MIMILKKEKKKVDNIETVLVVDGHMTTKTVRNFIWEAAAIHRKVEVNILKE